MSAILKPATSGNMPSNVIYGRGIQELTNTTPAQTLRLVEKAPTVEEIIVPELGKIDELLKKLYALVPRDSTKKFITKGIDIETVKVALAALIAAIDVLDAKVSPYRDSWIMGFRHALGNIRIKYQTLHNQDDKDNLFTKVLGAGATAETNMAIENFVRIYSAPHNESEEVGVWVKLITPTGASLETVEYDIDDIASIPIEGKKLLGLNQAIEEIIQNMTKYGENGKISISHYSRQEGNKKVIFLKVVATNKIVPPKEGVISTGFGESFIKGTLVAIDGRASIRKDEVAGIYTTTLDLNIAEI